jgi:hypothetical protein
LVAAIATLVFAGACASITVPTVPPVNIPSFPPINIPTIPPINIPTIPPVNVSSIPPINLPSIPAIAIPTFPPITLPSGIELPPGLLPSADANSGVCLLVSPGEISNVMGSQATVTDNSDGSCTYTFANFSAVVVSTESGDLSGLKFVLGNTAKDISVAGSPGITGVLIGQPVVYVQKGSGYLQVLGVLTGSDDATIAKLVQLATIAVGRMP